MAFPLPTEGPSRAQAGTGMVGALLAVPVLLLCGTVALQLFLVACARIQLSHAAFYAARVGSVRGAKATDEMASAVRGILRTGFVPVPPFGAGVGVEVLRETEGPSERGSDRSVHDSLRMVRVRAHWDYPLLVPLAGPLFSSARGDLPLPGIPTIRLTSTWAMPFWPGAGEVSGDD